MNFASLVLRQAELAPERLALAIPTRWDSAGAQEYATRTFGELAADVALLRQGLAAEGLRRGDRVVVMFPISPDLYGLALALLASGMALVLVDAGMGARRVLQAITDSRAAAIVTVEAVLRYRWLTPALWGLKRFTFDGRSGLGKRAFASLKAGATGGEGRGGAVALVGQEAAEDMQAEDHALITFTSGTTGRPKGADRCHGLLIAQHEALSEHFPERPGDIDMPCFPVVALHNLCCGITTVMPPVDLRAPAEVDPAAVLVELRRHQVTRLSGAPAYLSRVVDYMLATGARAPSVREVGVGGAVVTRDLCRRVGLAFPGAEAQVIYGSTEAEPMASASAAEVAACDGVGHLVGTAAQAATLALVALPADPPDLGDQGLEPWRVGQGDVGEVVVSGPHVNRGYLDNPAADRAHKLLERDGTVWHRTGDLGRFDAEGRLWLVGRVADALHVGGRVVHPFPVEEVIGRVPAIRRAALVAHAGAPEGEVAIELAAEDAASADGGQDRGPPPEAEVLEVVTLVLDALELPDVGVRVVERLPVDRRHGSKIDRPALRAALAAGVR